MLLSPASFSKRLHDLITDTVSSGPHTALLAGPHGQLVSSASLRFEAMTILEEEGHEEEEPWLDEPERMRLLLGLLSQWEEDESPRIECELGRLYVRSIKLPDPVPVFAVASLPAVRSAPYKRFVLLLNGTSKTPWSELTAKAESFQLS